MYAIVAKTCHSLFLAVPVDYAVSSFVNGSPYALKHQKLKVQI